MAGLTTININAETVKRLVDAKVSMSDEEGKIVSGIMAKVNVYGISASVHYILMTHLESSIECLSITRIMQTISCSMASSF